MFRSGSLRETSASSKINDTETPSLYSHDIGIQLKNEGANSISWFGHNEVKIAFSAERVKWYLCCSIAYSSQMKSCKQLLRLANAQGRHKAKLYSAQSRTDLHKLFIKIIFISEFRLHFAAIPQGVFWRFGFSVQIWIWIGWLIEGPPYTRRKMCCAACGWTRNATKRQSVAFWTVCSKLGKWLFRSITRLSALTGLDAKLFCCPPVCRTRGTEFAGDHPDDNNPFFQCFDNRQFFIPYGAPSANEWSRMQGKAAHITYARRTFFGWFQVGCAIWAQMSHRCEPNQSTYRQRLPKVCVYTAVSWGLIQDLLGFLVHFGLGIMCEKGICQVWIVWFLRSKGSNLEVQKK